MLIRSSSTPILNSWMPSHSTELSPEPEFFHQIRKPHLINLTTSFNSTSYTEDSTKKMKRAVSENDLRDLAVKKRKPFGRSLNGCFEESEEQELGLNLMDLSLDRLFFSSGIDESVEEGLGGGIGNDDGGSNGGVGDGFSNSNHGNDSTDAYYRKMIKSDPENALLLGNYAKFLKEVRGDLVKAEEYCERAILANPNNGNVLSLYGDLIWEVHKDASRAEKYFEQAVQAEPNDSYVVASYARFLWDAEEEGEEEEEEIESCKNSTKPSEFFQRVALPPIATY